MRDALVWGAILTVTLVVAYGAVAAAPEDDSIPRENFTVDSAEAETFQEQNAVREKHGINEVKRTDALDDAAKHWADRMASMGYLSHGPAQRRLERRADCPLSGEVAAQTYIYETFEGENDTVLIDNHEKAGEQLIKQWMNSPPHRRIMLEQNFTHVGVGINVTHRGELYAVMDYCRY
jgi:uncharacterized protein YkwD